MTTTQTALDAPYELLTPETAPAYVRSRPALHEHIDGGDIRSVREIGDGNLNLVFILADGAGRGLVLKQALPYVRLVGPSWPLGPDRARHEAESLRLHGRLAPGLVARLHDYDPDRYVLAIEDLSDHRVWRTALNDGLRHDGAAEAMGRYVAAVAFGTSVLGMDAAARAATLASSVNPELCLITEDLVFTEPYVDAGRNSVLPANEGDAAELAADRTMVDAMGRAKWTFMTRAEALVHGDLHTGSVMVRAADGEQGPVDSAKAFDPEFAFYGPVAFDLGALWGNYVIAAARATALGDDERAAWALGLCARTWDAFEAEFRRLWTDGRVDPRMFGDDLREHLLGTWRSEAWLFGAAKMTRRIVGLAKTTDIETLPPELREGAARGVLRTARRWVREREVDSAPRRAEEVAGELLGEAATRG
ncbi:S-methyl-5-thioribose kinase [Pseudonocardia humida]|uniref:S-methyl-5-thioribose kinase n=1 Tax=Pseudonocardia humida TaxID=2800819 RepID=A0ABT0ZXJ7_9PSEU|nr:S-methyl-5-thioribose kinase [Pseudonocardia humida]MCO1655463.1 S-methyl-5-thioribose kinase [Pseudonocardia humida]